MGNMVGLSLESMRNGGWVVVGWVVGHDAACDVIRVNVTIEGRKLFVDEWPARDPVVVSLKGCWEVPGQVLKMTPDVIQTMVPEFEVMRFGFPSWWRS